MRQCPHCQKDLPASAQFCSYCGKPVEDDSDQVAQPDKMTDIANEQHKDEPHADPVELLETVPQLPITPGEQEPDEDSQREDETVIPGETGAQPASLAVSAPEPAAIEQVDAPETPNPPLSEPDMQTPEPPAQLAHAQTPAPEEQPTPITQDEDATPQPLERLEESDAGPRAPQRKGRRRGAIIAALLIVLVVIAGGAGAFVLTRGQTQAGGASPNASQCADQQAGCAGNSPNNAKDATHLTFSGAASGPMKVNAAPQCQRAAVANLSTLTVTLTGVVGGQTYNFGFTIEHYNGPGTYTSATTSTTVLFNVPGESTTNGWGNNSPADSGTITITRGEQAGNISYLLHGFGTQSGTQIQVAGNWACAYH